MLLKNKHSFFIIAIAAVIALTLYTCEDSTSIEDTPRPAEGQAPAPTQSELQSQQPTLDAELIEGRYIVVFKDQAGEAITEQAAQEAVQLREEIFSDLDIPADSLIHQYKYALKGFAAHLSENQVDQLGGDTRIELVAQDFRFKGIQNSPARVTNSAPATMASQSVPWGVKRVKGPLDGTGTTAWILDTGIDLDHPDLNVDTGESASFVSGESSDDLNGHGTHVAGIVGAIDNDRDVVGVAAGATVVSIKVCDQNGDCYVSDVDAGVDHVAGRFSSGDVANLSLRWEVGSDDDRIDIPLATLETTITNAADNGLRFTLAAGNEADDASNYSPARMENTNVWTVSAFRDGDEFIQNFDWNTPNCGFPVIGSNYGNPIAYSAPGENILSLWRDGGTLTTCGTSFATPHIAGLLLASVAGIDADGTVSNDQDANPDPIGVKADSDVSVFIDGPTFVTNGHQGEWTAEVSGGFPPYSYKWFRSNTDPTWWQQVGTGSSYSETVTESFDLKVEVTDESNTTVSDEHSVSTN